MKSIKILLFIVLVVSSIQANCQWQPVGDGFNGYVNTLFSHPQSGKLYAGGNFTIAEGNQALFVASWDGFFWNPVGAGFNDEVSTFCVYKDTLYAGGYFTASGTDSIYGLAKWNGNKWVSVIPGFKGAVFSMVVFNNKLHIGGVFEYIGDTLVNNITSWDGSKYQQLFPGVAYVSSNATAAVTSLAVYQNSLVIGGAFNAIGSSYMGFNCCIIKWNGFSYEALDNRFSAPGGTVYDMKTYNGILYVSNGESGEHIFTYDGVERSTESNLPSDTYLNYPGIRHSYASVVYDNKIVFGGKFGAISTFQNTPTPCSARVSATDGNRWYDLDCGVNDEVYTLVKHNNDLYVGGRFTKAGTANALHVAKWTGPITKMFLPPSGVTNSSLNEEHLSVIKNGSEIHITNTTPSSTLIFFNTLGSKVLEVLTTSTEEVISTNNNLGYPLFFVEKNTEGKTRTGRVKVSAF